MCGGNGTNSADRTKNGRMMCKRLAIRIGEVGIVTLNGRLS